MTGARGGQPPGLSSNSMSRSSDPSPERGRAASARIARGRPEEVRCRWCGRAFVPNTGRGRPRVYCRQGCRQQAHLARKLATSHGLGEHDVIVGREALDELQSLVYCLQAAIEDVDRDLVESDAPADVREALDWLLLNARPLADCWIEPRTGEP